MEAAELGTFMAIAVLLTALLQHPESPAHRLLPDPFLRRVSIGVAMGATAAAIIYSPLGRRSGAHFNPSVTLTFLRLGRVRLLDACGYVLAQFAGGIAGVMLAKSLLHEAAAHPAVAYAATVPGVFGRGIAFAGELGISFVLMLVLLFVTNAPRLAPYAGLVAGMLVATWITWEAPLSGMSMNPARSLASALADGRLADLWIYFTAPLLGMLLAAEAYLRSGRRVRCAKLDHQGQSRCIFRCGWQEE